MTGLLQLQLNLPKIHALESLLKHHGMLLHELLHLMLILTYIDAGTSDYHLVAWIVENGLVGEQLDYRQNPSFVEDFKFEHVLRGSMNGTWGEQVSAEPVPAGTILERQIQYTFPSDKDWVPENCDLVVFVHEHNTSLEVVNVIKVKLVK